MPDTSSFTSYATGRADDTSPFGLGLLLRQAHDRVATHLAAAIAPIGIELRHFMVMMRLHADGEMQQGVLAERTHHDKATIVRIVDDLERKGFAVRNSVPGDRRARAVSLTSAGYEAFDAAHAAAAPAADELTQHLSPTQLDDVRKALTTIITADVPSLRD